MTVDNAQTGGTVEPIFAGSNSDRQSIGLPGHCERCSQFGHMRAHPNLGCSDVGCRRSHERSGRSDG